MIKKETDSLNIIFGNGTVATGLREGAVGVDPAVVLALQGIARPVGIGDNVPSEELVGSRVMVFFSKVDSIDFLVERLQKIRGRLVELQSGPKAPAGERSEG